jgi:hypothetical protein
VACKFGLMPDILFDITQIHHCLIAADMRSLAASCKSKIHYGVGLLIFVTLVVNTPG